MVVDYMAKLTMDAVFAIARNNNIEVKKDEIVPKLQATYKERFAKILEETTKDAKEADLVGGLERGKIHGLVNQVASVTIRHGCVMYAKELLGLPAETKETT